MAVLVHVVDALLYEASLGMLLAIKDVSLGFVVVAVLHQCKLYTVLYLFDGKSVAYGDALTQVGGYAFDLLLIQLVHRL